MMSNTISLSGIMEDLRSLCTAAVYNLSPLLRYLEVPNHKLKNTG